MDLCPKCFLMLLTLVRIGLVHSVLPIMLDYTQMLNADTHGIFDASHLADMPETPDRMKFRHNVVLSSDGAVNLSWNFTDKDITFKLSANTPGWIGFGISPNRLDNKEADFVAMGFKDEHTYITDMHIDKNGRYVVDEEQNVKGDYIWGTEEDTYAIFTRPLVTCDHKEDVEITSDTLRIIWAYGGMDIQGRKPMKDELFNLDSGSLNIKLLNPTPTPIQEDEAYPGTEAFEIAMDNVSVELGEYRHCTAFKFPNLSSKKYIVQFEPILTTGNEYNVRQITVRECSGTHQGLLLNSQADYKCEADISTSKCKTLAINWAIGMSTFTFPKEVGYLIGNSDTFFMMEIRYENLEDPGLRDSSGLRIYYTSEIRDHDGGILTTGSLVHQSQIIPPGSPNFRLQGHCMKTCVQLAFKDRPQEQVTIFAALLHARQLGRKIKLRHFRNGEELSPVAEDNLFHHLHHEPQFLKREVHLKTGDNMIVECTYDTHDKNEITYVNNSKGGESCLAFLSYYPKLSELTECETAPTENVIMATVGAARPEEMRKSAEEFQWTRQQTREFNDKVLESQVYVRCGGEPLKDPQPIPEIKKAFIEDHKCKRPVPTQLPRQNHTTTSGSNSSFISGPKILNFLASFSLLYFFQNFPST